MIILDESSKSKVKSLSSEWIWMNDVEMWECVTYDVCPKESKRVKKKVKYVSGWIILLKSLINADYEQTPPATDERPTTDDDDRPTRRDRRPTTDDTMGAAMHPPSTHYDHDLQFQWLPPCREVHIAPTSIRVYSLRYRWRTNSLGKCEINACW